MNTITILLIAFLLTTPSLFVSTRPEPDPDKPAKRKDDHPNHHHQSIGSSKPDPDKSSKEKGHQANRPHHQNPKGRGGSGSDGSGGFFGPGAGFDVPGFGKGWDHGIVGPVGGGFGSGFGGPAGGHSRNGVIRPTVVCKEKGPCYKKKLTCPAKCFSSYSHSGKNYGGGGGGGGCTIDCRKKCVAYC